MYLCFVLDMPSDRAYRALTQLMQAVVWECDLGNGCFVTYDTSDTERLEKALASGLAEVKVCGGKYGVDFRTLKQRNLVTGFERNVRRTERAPQMGQKKVGLNATRCYIWITCLRHLKLDMIFVHMIQVFNEKNSQSVIFIDCLLQLIGF